MKMKYFFG